MKLPEKVADPETVQLGIVKLGIAVGKSKYALIDEKDISIIRSYKFDARLEIDRNGDGISVMAMGHPKECGPSSPNPIPLQNIIWESHYGQIENGFKLSHRNGITMDNRIDNLILVPEFPVERKIPSLLPPDNDVEMQADFSSSTGISMRNVDDLSHSISDSSASDKSERRKGENSLYWHAITQLINNETEEQRAASTTSFARAYYTTEGDLISRDCPSFYYFECHYAPCTAVEKAPREFAMCGRCQVRYCGRECQRDDWPYHRDSCNESNRRMSSSSRSHKHKRRESNKTEAER